MLVFSAACTLSQPHDQDRAGDSLDTLIELEEAVGRVQAEPKPDLMAIFGRLDALTASLPRGTSPDLLHYLHKKSYQKARLFLLGQDPEQGDCPH